MWYFSFLADFSSLSLMTELPQGTEHKHSVNNAVFTLSSSVGVDATKMGFMGSLSCDDSLFAVLWIFFYLWSFVDIMLSACVLRS